MSILASIGLFALVAVCIFAGTMVGSAMSFRRFGSSGVGILGSGGSFAACVTIAAASAGGPLTWVFAGLAAAIFGIMMRGAAN